MNSRSRIIPLKIKLIITFSIMVIISLGVQVGISYFFLYNIIEEKTTKNYNQTIDQANRRIDESLLAYEKVTRNIIANNTIQDDLRGICQDTKAYQEVSLSIKQELAKITIADEHINSIHIVPKDRRTISYLFTSNQANYEAISILPWFEEVKNSTGKAIWIPTFPTKKKMIGNMHTYVFSVIRKINDLDTGRELGFMIINIDAKHLQGMMDDIELGKSGRVYLVDEHNRIIYYEDQELIGDLFSYNDDEDTIMVDDISPMSHWKLIGLIPRSNYRKEIEQFNLIFLYLTIIVIGVISIFAIFISKSIVNPIKKIISSMKEVKKGNFNVKITHKQNNEIGILAGHFDEMTDEIKYLIDEVYKQEIIKREAELKALHAQLNPHFLYNTLDTIYWMLILKEEDEIGDLVVALSNILRYSISRGDDFVSIEEDIKQLNNYLEIQKARFEEKLVVTLDIAPHINGYIIPKLLLQPLVENAIKHGFKDMKVKGEIHIRGYVEEETLNMEVTDNGVGIPEGRIQDILLDNLEVEDQHTGLGLKTIDDRIKILYGRQYGLHIDSIPYQSTRVSIQLPIKVEASEAFTQ